MTMKAARLHLKLFIEGVQCPVISAVVTSQDNQPAVAQIQIVPTPMARRLMNRTKVDLFFHDLYAFNEASRSRVFYGGEGGGDVTAQQQMAILGPEGQEQADIAAMTGETAGETMSSIVVPPDLLRYRLMFTGDVIGITYTKTATGGRAVILQCASNSSYWDILAADQKGGMLFGGSRRSTYAGVTQSPFWDLLGGNTAEVFEKLTQAPASFPNLTGFTAGVLNCMEALFGVYYRRTRDGRVIIGANQFLALTEIRLRLLQQIGVAGGNDSPLRLMRARGFGSIWRPALRGLPRYFGFRHLLNALMPYTFFEHTPILCPHYTPPTGTYASYANWAGYTTGFLRNSPQWSWIARDADNMRGVVNGYLDNDLTDVATIAAENGSVEDPEFDSLPTDIANDVATIKDSAKGIYDGITQRQERGAIYRKMVTDPGERDTFVEGEPYYDTIQAMTDEERRNRGIETIQQFGAEAIRRLEPVAAWAKSIEGTCGEMISLLAGGVNLPARPDQRVNDKLKAIDDDAKKIAEYAMPPPSRTDADADSEPAHLYCDVLRPDVWFVPPPRSNVIFPDHVVSLQFGRVFGQEPTRLMVKMYDKLLGSSPLFDKWWIAPTAPGLFRQRPIAASGAARASIKRDLMDHELAGGIIPIFHSMSDREMFLGARVSGYGANNPEMGDDQKRYFQQVTNFLLFKARFAARQLNVECRYNPYLIQGFPALIIDVPPNAVDTELNQSILNTATEALETLGAEQSAVILDMIRDRTGGHYLGTIKQLSHAANATGESCGTSITFGYAREHNERIEYMGQDIIRAAQERSRRQTQRTVARDSANSARIRRSMQQMMQAEFTERKQAEAYGGLLNDPAALHEAQSLGHDADSLMIVRTTALEPMADQLMDRVTIELPTRKTSVVFCLDAPTARQGTPAVGDEAASDDYVAGQLGPHGLDIIEATEVTDQYKNSRRRTNTSGTSAADAERNYLSAIELRRAAQLARDSANPATRYTDPSAYTPGGQTSTDTSQYTQTIARANALDQEAQILEEIVADREAGWRYEMATLPFISSPRDGRGRAVTSITTDKIGVPVDARSIPQLAGAIGILNNEPYSVILKVYRIVEDASGDPSAQFDLAAEDILRPPWYDNLWCNDLVGGGVYLPLFGTGSIVDPLEVLNPEAMDVFGDPGRARDAVQQVRQEQQTNAEGGLRMAGILSGSTIENAVDWLAHTYAMTRTKGYDTDSFVRNYTWRPIATMFDMYGSGDLELDPDGRKVVHGVEGFHSRAFGPHQNLFGLIPYNDISMFLGIDESDTAASARVDIRARRHAIVMAYSQELLTLRGCASG